MSAATIPDINLLPRRSQRGEPTWEVALAYPRQGEWTESEYLALQNNHFVELSDGFLEFLPMPLPLHQKIVEFLFLALKAFVSSHALGDLYFAPLPVHLWFGKFREPDIVFLKPGRLRDLREPPEGADLAVEVVSEGEENRRRDLTTKRLEYAHAGIFEYWIVDPENRQITVLTLDTANKVYREHGVFGAGSRATSVLLVGFEVDVNAVFAAGEQNLAK
jgi:Uma2 family endonuclease